MAANFEKRLKGGHPNSLGNTIEVVEEVLETPTLFEELFNCYFSPDEVVRLRVSNAMKRVCRANRPMLIPYIDRLLQDVSQIDQASTQWTLATLFHELKSEMSISQKNSALVIMKGNLEHHNDWIVLNTTMQTLAQWDSENADLQSFLSIQLQRLAEDDRKSVSKRAQKLLATINS